MKAAILAGGLGKRLRPLTDDRPKPMIEVSGTPILGWQIAWLASHAISDIVLCTGYMRESIINYVGNGSKFGVRVGYVTEDEPLGTGGALKNAESLLRNEESFFVLNGDVLTNLDPNRLVRVLGDEAVGAIATVPLRSPFGIVDAGEDGQITGFREKPVLENYWINAGVYCLSSSILAGLQRVGDLESEVFPQLVRERSLRAVRYSDTQWRSIDSHKDIDEAAKELEKT
ncbi:MAG: nucleotidyltransferase family protein [Nitrososphaerales archaeon]